MLATPLPAFLFWNPWLEAYFQWINTFKSFEPQYRQGFIQHPCHIPLSVKTKPRKLKTPSSEPAGPGLCFKSSHPYPIGSHLEIGLNLNDAPFKGDALVAWVQPEEDAFWIGVHFLGRDASYSMRMAEQICQIEHYRQDVLHNQGRRLSAEEAAAEWVDKYAARFPVSL